MPYKKHAMQNQSNSVTATSADFYASANNGRHRALFSVGSSGCLFLNSYISVLSGGISMKLATNIHHVSGNC